LELTAVIVCAEFMSWKETGLMVKTTHLHDSISEVKVMYVIYKCGIFVMLWSTTIFWDETQLSPVDVLEECINSMFNLKLELVDSCETTWH
jgi:hypothetical protein